MKNLETVSGTVEDGQIVLNLPEIDDGTDMTFKVVGIEETDNHSVNNNGSNTKHKISEPNKVDPQHKSENNNDNVNIENNKNNEIKFSDLNLIDAILEGVYDMGYTNPTPIQKQAIPLILANKDVLATAQTGSGKTAAFTLPMLQQLEINKSDKKKKKLPKALILAPTRELAKQIAGNVKDYGFYTNLHQVVIYGGVSQKPQVKRLRKGVDIIIATPGRLIDLINQGEVKLENIDLFILDEADRMLDMGFIHDIRRISKHMPRDKQVLLFSATIPDAIKKLAKEIQSNPEYIAVDPPASTVDTVESRVFFVERSDKYNLLLHLFETEEMEKTLIFMRTKHTANKLVRKLSKRNFDVDAIHGNKSQNAREKSLKAFRDDRISVLVGTDVASRGIDVDDITHVINYDMSNEAEVYIHRIGRTARAGRKGMAFNFCDTSERRYLKDIEKLIGEKLQPVTGHPFESTVPFNAKNSRKGKRRGGKNNSNKKGNRRRKKYYKKN